MYKFKSSLFGLLGVATLIAIVTIVMPHMGRGDSGTATAAPASQPQNVNVVNSPTVKIDPTNPLSVRDVDNPARQPFQTLTSLVLPFGQASGTQISIVVPAGKLLVVEEVSAEGRLAGVDKLISLTVSTGGASYHLHPNDAGTDDLGRRVYSASQHVRLYVTAGNAVVCYAERSPATGQPGITFSIYGYFVDAP